jgi:hypothetical protein
LQISDEIPVLEIGVRIDVNFNRAIILAVKAGIDVVDIIEVHPIPRLVVEDLALRCEVAPTIFLISCGEPIIVPIYSGVDFQVLTNVSREIILA